MQESRRGAQILGPGVPRPGGGARGCALPARDPGAQSNTPYGLAGTWVFL